MLYCCYYVGRQTRPKPKSFSLFIFCLLLDSIHCRCELININLFLQEKGQQLLFCGGGGPWGMLIAPSTLKACSCPIQPRGFGGREYGTLYTPASLDLRGSRTTRNPQSSRGGSCNPLGLRSKERPLNALHNIS